ncbi:rolling circle replication-associated protein [Rathayibacter sp. Leaf248]|uniref:rolling circle replication-associated protein n=1 Tax=Rathayibacter sp. Leaf248 TaxID=2876555 RepID=UPI001E633101|nr:hypothetical protein [Rathayibacter sp. Leaf248]
MSSAVSPLVLPAYPVFDWRFTLYPDAGEGGGTFRSSVRKAPTYVARGQAADPERALAEAGRRARSRLRRYCAANGLNRLGTLTYAGAGCHEPDVLRSDLARFFRNLRQATGGAAFPYVWVPEWHKSGHGLHAHFAVGRYLKRSLIEQAWGHGFVHIKLLGDLPVGSGRLAESRKAAGYLSKYVAKTFTDPTIRQLGLHRYDVAQGFKPRPLALAGTSAWDVMTQATEAMGGVLPSIQWSSSQEEEWAGAPAIWAQWNI